MSDQHKGEHVFQIANVFAPILNTICSIFSRSTVCRLALLQPARETMHLWSHRCGYIWLHLKCRENTAECMFLGVTKDIKTLSYWFCGFWNKIWKTILNDMFIYDSAESMEIVAGHTFIENIELYIYIHMYIYIHIYICQSYNIPIIHLPLNENDAHLVYGNLTNIFVNHMFIIYMYILELWFNF